MAVELIWNDKTYEIAKKTVDISDKMDQILEMSLLIGRDDKKKAFKAEYDFILSVMGEDKGKEALDCESFKDVDVEVMITLFNAIGYAWQRVRRNFEWKQTEEAMNNPVVAKAVDLSSAVDKIMELA